jgi:hypothetical protein
MWITELARKTITADTRIGTSNELRATIATSIKMRARTAKDPLM